VATTGGIVTTVLYDDSASTGLVVGLAANAPIVVRAPWGASCSPAYAWNIGLASDAAATASKASGCVGGCAEVREVEFGADSRKLLDIWR
jgi:hypothetical protein